MTTEHALQKDTPECDRAAFALSHMGLVHAFASRFAARGLDREELVQAGCVGLLRAMETYDAARGTAFSTYATPFIVGEMRRLGREARPVHISRELGVCAGAARAASDALRNRLGREPTLTEVAEAVHCTPETLTLALGASEPTLSLDASASDARDEAAASPLSERLADVREDSAHDGVLVRQLMEALSPRLRGVLLLRFFRGMTQTDTARMLGVSQTQISRAEKQVRQMARAIWG